MTDADLTRSNDDFLLYQSEDGKLRIDVRLKDETVWLTQQAMIELFQTSKSNISEHIKHIFEEGELIEESVVRKFRTTASDGKGYETKQINWLWIVFYRQNKNYFTLSMEHKLI